MTVDEVRQKYLDFFAKRGHHVVPSASLIPENDPTTLFTSAGMQSMIPYLLGGSHPEGKRITNSQKCFRTQDIDEVGDNRHTTFFEMLGNWSFGDYFKNEQIQWVFEFVTKELGLDPARLYVTCYSGNQELGIESDEKTAEIWKGLFKGVNVPAEVVKTPAKRKMMNGQRIFFYGDDKNWWSRAGKPEAMPEGEPGGPDSEIFWDFDPNNELKLHENSKFAKQNCHPNCDCGRFLEIGNSVFMEYIKTKKGFEPLSSKNIDFGGGLERMVAAAADDPDIFLIDVFDAVRQELEKMSGKSYGENKEETQAFRVILDHLRAATFLIADGAFPSNKDQGYFTRRLVRRAVRYANQLGIKGQFTSHLAELFVESYRNSYSSLLEFKDRIMNELDTEENKFMKTLAKGLKEFDKGIEGDLGERAFFFFESHGFPLELFMEELDRRGIKYDEKELKAKFTERFKVHQELSRAGAEKKFKGGLADSGEMSVKYHTATHLLQAALRKVLGNHVEQRGSNITEKRLRFDFSHPDKMTDEQKSEVEQLVNNVIAADLPVTFEEMSVEEAKKQGAIGLFDSKYGDKVKVYTIGDFSKEICGGPHVERTSGLGHFKIKKEQASSAGVRRIKAVLE